MKKGEFYSSTGVKLSKVDFDTQSRTLHIAVDAETDVTYEVQFIGCRRIGDKDTKSPDFDPSDAGEVFAAVKGSAGEYRMKGDELYVRAKVISNKLHPNPPVTHPTGESATQHFETAWTQPVGWTASEIKR